MPSKKQQKGYRSNGKVREWLLEHGFTYIYFHPHPPQYRLDYIKIDREREMYARDLLGLFDGFAIDTCGDLVFFQVKTNSWDGAKEIEKFTEGKHIKAILFNAVDREGVRERFINYPEFEVDLNIVSC